MKNKLRASALVLLLAGLAVAAAYGLYALGLKQGMGMQAAVPGAPVAAADPGSSIAAGEEATRRHIKDGLKSGQTDPANGKPILYYHDPMVPGKRFDAPAKSPFMDMMLVPVYGGGDAQDTGKVTVSPRIQQNLGVRTAEVVEGVLKPQLSAIGNIAYNERDQSVVQSRAMGFVEKLHVRATLDRVSAGQPFADLYVPEWVAAQEEFLGLKKAPGADAGLISAARQRMRLLGMDEAQIGRVENNATADARITLTVPTSGVVAELVAREGMTVAPGMMLARINGLATVWVQAEVPESQAAALQTGMQVEARTPAAPGTVFKGTVQAILPDVTVTTRTIKARVQLANAGGRLSPGMFVTLQFMDSRGVKALLVPTEAVIATGQRSVVMLAEEGGRFRPVDVEVGIDVGGQTEIRKGLKAGQRVVVSSQFLIDSEASLKGVESRLNGVEPAKPVTHLGSGTVISIDRDSALLAHGPLPSAGMGAMTMEFKSPVSGVPRNVAKGDKVEFEFTLPKDDIPLLTRIVPIAPALATTGTKAGAKP